MADTNTQAETPIFPSVTVFPPPARVETPVFPNGAVFPPPARIPATVPVQNSNGEAVTVPFGTESTTLPPKDVTDAAMLLTEVCNAWTPTELPVPNTSGPPQPPIFHNETYVLHRDLCTLATDPVGFSKKIDDVFFTGMLAAVLLIVLAYLVIRLGNWVRKRVRALFSRRKERSAEALRCRLLVEAARTKLDAKNNPAPGAAE